MAYTSTLDKYRFGSYNLSEPFKTASICGVCSETKQLFAFPVDDSHARVCASCVKKALTAKSVPPYSLLHYVRKVSESMEYPCLYVKASFHEFAYNYAKFVITCSQLGEGVVKFEADKLLFSNSSEVIRNALSSHSLEDILMQSDSDLKKSLKISYLYKPLTATKPVKPYTYAELVETTINVIVERILIIFSNYISDVQKRNNPPVICKNCMRVCVDSIREDDGVYPTCIVRTCKTRKQGLKAFLDDKGSSVFEVSQRLVKRVKTQA